MGFSQVQVSSRDRKRIQRLDSILPCKVVPWEERHKAGADLLINATSVGMSPENDKSPMEVEFLRRARGVLDVVVSPMESCLIQLARSIGKDVAPGYLMSLEQAIEQFKLYTGETPPRDVMEQSLKRLLAN
jgi:shikimate 5-dehydrogenase